MNNQFEDRNRLPPLLDSFNFTDQPTEPLPADLALKVSTQMSRLESMKDIEDSLNDMGNSTSLSKVNLEVSMMETLHNDFQKEHAYLVSAWPPNYIHHEYFACDLFQQEAQVMMRIKREAGRLIDEGTKNLSQKSVTNVEEVKRAEPCGNVPELELPTFKGNCLEWPRFINLFTSRILNQSNLNNIEKLCYLRQCLEGEPAKLISGLALVNESFTTSLKMLNKWYLNKRLLIDTEFDRLFHIPALKEGNSSNLMDLISKVTTAITNLKIIGVTDFWDCFLVYHVSRCLDLDNWKCWTMSVGTFKEYPRFEQLENFIKSRARVMRALELFSHNSSTPIDQQPPLHATLAVPSTSSSSGSAAEIFCDCCQAKHFIMRCPKFMKLSVANRLIFVADHYLCTNCLKRHKLEDCKSKITCNVCNGRHNTMLHDED